MLPPSSTRTGPTVTKAANVALTRRTAVPPTECLWKKPHVDEPSHVPSESSHTNYRKLSRSMSELEDHRCFTAPTSSSTSNKSRPQQCYRSSSTNSRLSTIPLDAGFYNSFSYSGPAGFYRGRATPITSVAGSYHVSSSAWQPPGLTSPPATQTLSAEQSTEIFNLAVECQALSTDLAKQFQKLSGLKAMHCTTAQATANETINVGQMAQNTAYNILPDGQTWDKKHEETLQQLHAEADKAWKDTYDLVFQHQLHYDVQLMAFISDAERTLQEK